MADIALTVFGLDPGTRTMGVAVVQFGWDGKPIQAFAKCFDANHIKATTEGAKFDRIDFLRTELSEWTFSLLSTNAVAIDVRAYEPPFAMFELAQLVGACMSLGALYGLPCTEVMRALSCKAAQCFDIYKEEAKHLTPAQKREKQARLKAAVMLWAGDQFAHTSVRAEAGTNEHIADALAICQSVFDAWHKQHEAKQLQLAVQKTMFAQNVGKAGAKRKTKVQAV